MEDHDDNAVRRREFLSKLAQVPCAALVLGVIGPFEAAADEGAESEGHYYGMGVQIDRCIGCGLCVEACKNENDVPREPYYFRTWVERYQIHANDDVVVDGGVATVDPMGNTKSYNYCVQDGALTLRRVAAQADPPVYIFTR